MPLLPVMVSGYVPVDAGLLMVIFNVEGLPAATELGVKLALVFEGRPEILRATELLAPLSVVVTVTEPFDPRWMVIDDAESEIPKSAGVATLNETEAL